MRPRSKARRGLHFLFFKIKHASSHKIIKYAYVPPHLCDVKLHQEHKQTRFFTPICFLAKIDISLQLESYVSFHFFNRKTKQNTQQK